MAAAAALFAWFLLRDDDSGPVATAPDPVAQTASPPRAASSSALADLPATAGHPVYWVGPRARNTYEVTETADGRFYIRYLPPGVRLGDPRPNFLTVGTYPVRNAFQVTRAVGRKVGGKITKTSNGGVVVYNERRPTSVYVAYPGTALQVEIFSPDAAAALRLALSGRVIPLRT